MDRNRQRCDWSEIFNELYPLLQDYYFSGPFENHNPRKAIGEYILRREQAARIEMAEKIKGIRLYDGKLNDVISKEIDQVVTTLNQSKDE